MRLAGNARAERNISTQGKKTEVSMKIKLFALTLLALSLGTTGWVKAKAQEAPPPPPGYAQDGGGWDNPPTEFRDVQRQGYHDGIEGARRDYDNHRRSDVNNREEYRHPRVERSAREDYREGYRRGYERAMNHLMGDRDRDHDRDHHDRDRDDHDH
jgi:hypothetical protein